MDLSSASTPCCEPSFAACTFPLVTPLASRPVPERAKTQQCIQVIKRMSIYSSRSVKSATRANKYAHLSLLHDPPQA